MAISVKKITLWRREVPNRPGMLAQTLEPLSRSGANLQVVMGYHMGEKAIIEVFPVSGKKGEAAARQAGLAASGPPALMVQGDNRAGLVPHGDQAGKVRKSQQRVTRRFDPEQLRSARCKRLRGCFAGKIDELNVEMSLRS